MCNPILVTTFSREAQQYRTMAANTGAVRPRHVCSVNSFAGLIRWTPPPTYNDTAIPIPLFSRKEYTGSWSIGAEKSFGHVPSVGVQPAYPRSQALSFTVNLKQCRTSDPDEISHYEPPYLVVLFANSF